MAGRPKTMAKRLAEIEERAFRLSVDLCKLRPYQYREREGAEGEDEYAAVWNAAVRATSSAANAVNHLLGLAEERAGLDFDVLDAERDRRRGTWPLDVPADEAAVPGTTWPGPPMNCARS